MAVDDFLSRDTDAFVLPSKSYYPLKIPIAHYQLRHFISSPEPDLIYYASAEEVYCLNAATRIQARIATLPWEARCTASGFGYVCVGGAEHGNFAAIKVTGFPPADPADVDALLPLDLSTRTTLPRPPVLASPSPPTYATIGDDIVNSISIHKLAADGHGPDDVVAVLTNNDKSVRIFSLTTHEQIAELWLPFPMNHATISPDGELLVAVGDHHVGYFFKRTKNKNAGARKTTEEQVDHQGWEMIQEVTLFVPPESSLEGYFTTAWSPSGRLCAVGSESGYITVFDVQLLLLCEFGEDAIIRLISSTRPDTHGSIAGPGAVRTMQFSPSPWDFLIWSEDQARVCIADLRSDLKVRQVLTLDHKEEGLDKVQIADFDVELNPTLNNLEDEENFIRRYHRTLDTEGNAAAVNLAYDYMDSTDRRRAQRHRGVVESDNDPHGLTAHERQVLEALRTTRQRDSTREQAPAPRSINYNLPGSSTQGRSTTITSTAREREAVARRTADILTEFISGREGPLHQRQDWRPPRRQASVVVSLDMGAGTSEPSTNITGTATTRSPNPISAQTHTTNSAQARRDNEIIASTDDAWRTIEEALARNARAADSARNSATPELRNELRRLRQLTAMRERLRNAREATTVNSYNLSTMGYRRASSRNMHNPHDGLRTAGLCMSPDGRTLYCGTEEGIFEFHINLHPRKLCPAITPR